MTTHNHIPTLTRMANHTSSHKRNNPPEDLDMSAMIEELQAGNMAELVHDSGKMINDEHCLVLGRLGRRQKHRRSVKGKRRT